MSTNYELDIDNVIKILKDDYGYGDIGVGYFEEFENIEISKNVMSDKELARKVDEHINRFGEN